MTLVNRTGTAGTIASLERELLPSRSVEERVPAPTPIVQDINVVKARLDQNRAEQGRLRVEEMRLAFQFHHLLKNQKVQDSPFEFQHSTLAEDMFGEGVTGFENSPMRGK